jgi:hypothetical protein
VWAVEPSGKWTLTRRGTKGPAASGKLSERQIEALAVLLATMRFNSLPGRIGLPAEELVAEEKRHFVSLSFGTKRVALITKEGSLHDALPPLPRYEEFKDKDKDGSKDKGVGAGRLQEHEDWARFVALTAAVKEILNGAKPEEPARPRDGDDKEGKRKD